MSPAEQSRAIKAAMPSFIDCLTAFVLAGVFVFLLAAVSVVADGSGAPATPDGALALRAEPASSLDASRFDHLAGDAK